MHRAEKRGSLLLIKAFIEGPRGKAYPIDFEACWANILQNELSVGEV